VNATRPLATLEDGTEEGEARRIPPGVRLAAQCRVFADRTYGVVAGRPLQLDLYVPPPGPAPSPVFLFFHGGGWVTGSREAVSLHVLPWLEAGWAVANAEYRLAREAPAPAAAWDARRALRWAFEQAAQYGLAADRVVVGGMSSGGHLALLAGMGSDLPEPSDGMEGPRQPVRPSAIVSWFGISDVAALLEGDRPRAYARRWIGRRPDASRVARDLSPLRWVMPGAPPVISVHGDCDPTVPYEQSHRLHEALHRAGVRNRLVTIEGGGHGDFDAETWARAYRSVFAFLS
jgi:acetyl esterase/lipase